MAKIKFGAVVTDMRNKIGDQVFSKNRGGAYVRSFKSHVLSSTPDQITVRNRLASFAGQWKALTQSQRDNWNSSVSSFQHTDIFGSMVKPSGFDLYVKLNCNLDQVGVTPLTSPPIPGVLAFISNLVVTADSSTPAVTITADYSALNSDYIVIYNATECISPGKAYVKNLLRSIAVRPWMVSMGTDFTSEYQGKFTNIFASQRISVSVVVVNVHTGQKTKPLFATCIVSGPAGLDYNQALDTGIPLT